MLSSREAFKVGLLARCTVDNLSRDETLSLVKRASEKLAGMLGDIGSLGTKAVGISAPLALAAPPIAGGLLGLGLAKATDIGDEDVKAVKDQELISTLRMESERLKRQAAARQFAKARMGGRSHY